jgi:hypothetical protein
MALTRGVARDGSASAVLGLLLRLRCAERTLCLKSSLSG